MHNCQKILTVSVLQKGYLYLLFRPQLFTVLLSPLLCQYILNRKQLEYKISIHPLFVYFYTPPQTVFVGGYTVFTLSDRVSESPKRFCVRNVLFL